MKFNDENKNSLVSRKAFSNVLEDVTSKIILRVSPQTPNFEPHDYDRLCWYIVFDPLVKVFHMPEFQTLNLVST